MNYNILIKSQSLPLLSIFIIYFLFIVPHFAEAAAISFDSANQINPANISDAEMTMTIAEANETLLCFAADDEITNVDTAVFDEQEMSNLVEVTDVKGFFKFWAFYLINPAIGTHTASFTRTTSTIGNEWLIHCSAYKNTAQSAPETYSIQSDSAITTHTANVTTLTPKAWTVM